MKIEKNKSLKSFNTFGLDVRCKKFVSVKSVEEAKEVIHEFKTEKHLILGGGSNILFTKDFDGLIVHNAIQGNEIVKDDQDERILKFGAGELWHNTVLHCIDEGLGGIENLSLIPGSIGAAPMQNIGAYGVEIKEVFESLEALHIESGEVHTFNNEDCQFAYRESVFKRDLKNQYLILNVSMRLQKRATLNTTYGAINSQLEKMGVDELSIKSISDAVIAIRQSKLPDPKEIGNSGSFFKNPIVSKDLLIAIQTDFPDVVNYPVNEKEVKLAAGWLIDQAGWKGKRIGDYGVHKNQALVLVNYGKAKGQDIYNLSEEIRLSIKEKFNVDLEREVNII